MIFLSKNRYERVIYVNIWQKPNGEIYTKLTRHRVFGHRLSSFAYSGYLNSYDHKLLDSIKLYFDISKMI